MNNCSIWKQFMIAHRKDKFEVEAYFGSKGSEENTETVAIRTSMYRLVDVLVTRAVAVTDYSADNTNTRKSEVKAYVASKSMECRDQRDDEQDLEGDAIR